MLRRVAMEGIELPKLYIAEDSNDVKLAKENGIPYIVWKQGLNKLIETLLRPALEKMFPYIRWNAILGEKKLIKSKVIRVPGNNEMNCATSTDDVIDNEDAIKAQMDYQRTDPFDKSNTLAERIVDIADDRRVCPGGYNNLTFEQDSIDVFDYIGDISSSVDIEVLQKLQLLPQFVGDITNCIRMNISSNIKWTESYNKKYSTIGRFERKGVLPNLLIIDISHSIPDGIASTMIALANTLRNQCNADLIITSRRSCYYPAGSELPDEQTIRDYFGRSNESREFLSILENYIRGREFGHVISFGDYDEPGMYVYRNHNAKRVNLSATKVHEVHHYHTTSAVETGYARWVYECSPEVISHYDTSWCSVLHRY